MHSMGLHSALAIKRQRKRRDEQRRARERRYSQQSNESGLGESNSSFVSPRSSVRGRHRRHQSSNAPDVGESKMMSSVGMLHIGVVFLVLGGFLLGSGLLPEDITSWSHFTTTQWWNELTVAGGCAILLGVFLIVLNRYMAQREEDDLTEYVQRQLTRSRSGHRLVRDVETGALTNKHNVGRTAADRAAARSPTEPEVFTAAKLEAGPDGGLSPIQSPTMRSPPHHLHCDLEQILEEDGVSDRGDLMAPSPASAFSQALILDADSPSETRELLHHVHHHGPVVGHHHGQVVEHHRARLDSQHSRHDSQHSRHDSQHSRHESEHSRHDSHHSRHDSHHSRHDSHHGSQEVPDDVAATYGQPHHHPSHHMVVI